MRNAATGMRHSLLVMPFSRLQYSVQTWHDMAARTHMYTAHTQE